MKKIYISPAVNMTRMQMESLVCESLIKSEQPVTSETPGFEQASKGRGGIFSSDDEGYKRSLW